MFTNITIVEANSEVFWGRGITYFFLMTALVMTVRVYYLMYKGANEWTPYKLAFDKRPGVYNLVSHLKILSGLGISSIAAAIIFDTSYAGLFYFKLQENEEQ